MNHWNDWFIASMVTELLLLNQIVTVDLSTNKLRLEVFLIVLFILSTCYLQVYNLFTKVIWKTKSNCRAGKGIEGHFMFCEMKLKN